MFVVFNDYVWMTSRVFRMRKESSYKNCGDVELLFILYLSGQKDRSHNSMLGFILGRYDVVCVQLGSR